MNMKILSLGGIVALMMTACASTAAMQASNFEETRKSVSVVLMEPDVEVRFDKVGSTDLRVDWTQQAQENLRNAIVSHLEASGETVTEFEKTSISQAELDQMLALNGQVNTAMGQHVVNIGNTPFLGVLPHKREREKDRKRELNYSLGEALAPVRATTNADYAAFMTYRAVIESGGSMFTKIAIGALTGYVQAGTDFRGTMVNLVDLKTGEVVWLNSDRGAGLFAGDARDADHAIKTITGIMDEGPFVDAEE